MGVRILEQAARGKRHADVAQAVGYGAIQALVNLLRGCAEDVENCTDTMAMAVIECLDVLSRTPRGTHSGVHVQGVAWKGLVLRYGATQPLMVLAASPMVTEAVQSAAVRACARHVVVSLATITSVMRC